VLELAANMPPTRVPALPEHFVATQAIVHSNTLDFGAPDAGLETVTEDDWATSAIDPELVTVPSVRTFAGVP